MLEDKADHYFFWILIVITPNLAIVQPTGCDFHLFHHLLPTMADLR